MYSKFYNFREKPFNLVPNPAYLFLSSKHNNALTFLEYGLSEKVGFVMLTGEIGIGKTTLVRHLLNKIESEMDVAVIFNTNLAATDLIKAILTEFEVDYDDAIPKTKALKILYEFLIQRYAKKRKVLLIIDEAQNLAVEVLEEIRMLSNLQTDDEMLLQIMIVGQPELREKVSRPGLEQFAQRIAVSYHLSSMTLEETGEYIAYRLRKAGGSADLFSTAAIEKVFELSAGIPRTINLLCDASLVYGYADERKIIDVDIVDQVVEEKGGVGIFTRTTLRSGSGNVTNGMTQEQAGDLLQRIKKVETSFEQVKSLYHGYAQKLEKDTKKAQYGTILDLKTSLEKEKKRNEKLVFEYGRLSEKYRLLKKRLTSVKKW